MRRLILVPLFALIGCWDFAALNATNNLTDGGGPDLFQCDKTKTTLVEDCTNGIDDNDDCLTDCEDPTCSGNVKCFDPNKTLLGYGNRIAVTGSCPGTQTATGINQNLTLNADCSTGCACQAGNNQTCSSKLHWFDDVNKCNGNMERGNANLLSSAGAAPTNDCDALTTPPNPATTDFFKIDAITSTCPLDATKQGTKTATWVGQSKLCTTAVTPTTCQDLKCMQNSANCIAYTGNMPTCPAPFSIRELWYKDYTDNRICTCTCTAGAGSCSISGTQAQFTDSATCSGGGQKTSPATTTAACFQSNIMTNMVAAAALSFQARPICQAAGTAPTDLTAEMAASRVTLNNPITLCCVQ